jgi:class 3 adenylate cyclase
MANDQDNIEQLREWLKVHHGVELDAKTLVDPVNMAARLESLARDAAQSLPFDIDPTGFARLFAALAPERGADDR